MKSRPSSESAPICQQLDCDPALVRRRARRQRVRHGRDRLWPVHVSRSGGRCHRGPARSDIRRSHALPRACPVQQSVRRPHPGPTQPAITSSGRRLPAPAALGTHDRAGLRERAPVGEGHHRAGEGATRWVQPSQAPVRPEPVRRTGAGSGYAAAACRWLLGKLLLVWPPREGDQAWRARDARPRWISFGWLMRACP